MPEQDIRTNDDTRPPEGAATANEILKAAKLLVGWNADLLRFYAQRAVRYGELPLRLMACSNAADLQKLQHDFLRQLTDEYQDEAARLSKITGQSDERPAASSEEQYAASLNRAQADAARIVEEAKAQAERIIASAQAQADGSAEEPKAAKRRASGA